MTSRVVKPSHKSNTLQKISEGIRSEFGHGKRIRRNNDGKRETVVSLFHRESPFDDSGEKGDPKRRCSKREKQQPFAVAQEKIYSRVHG